jgi:acyl-CoA synthetase (AMP-forming)/AMP-acid ligase II
VTGDPLDEAELSAFVTERLAGYKQPRRYIFVPEIRRSPAGKADRAWAVEIARGA